MRGLAVIVLAYFCVVIGRLKALSSGFSGPLVGRLQSRCDVGLRCDVDPIRIMSNLTPLRLSHSMLQRNSVNAVERRGRTRLGRRKPVVPPGRRQCSNTDVERLLNGGRAHKQGAVAA